jgi:hypothetical protein
MAAGHFRDHLSVIGRSSEQLRLERDDGRGLAVERLGEVGRLDLRPLRDADLIERIERTMVVDPCGLQIVDEILGVAQIGEVRRPDDEDIVGVSKIESNASAPKS